MVITSPWMKLPTGGIVTAINGVGDRRVIERQRTLEPVPVPLAG